MSIFKSTFTKEVKEQLAVRQKAIANRTPESIQYINSRNSWIRMTSSVNVDGSADLAKQYVLLGGTLDNGKLRSGVGNKNEAYSTVSPGGNPHLRGIRPMPGITSIEVKSKSAYGSLREVTINFQCWDIEQLQDLEVLYMRPGYTALIEWGWFPYLDNAGKLITTFPGFYDILNKPQTNRTELFKALYQKSLDSSGNYDAMFGYIKNYQWSARPDGGYDCTTTLISTGEIIESLKMNYNLPTRTDKSNGLLNKEFTSQGTSNSWVDFYQKNILAGLWAELLYKTKDPGASFSPNSFIKDKVAKVKIPGIIDKDNKNSLSDDENQVYITLEGIFYLLNEGVIAKSKTDGEPLVKLSIYSKELNSNGSNDLYCIAHPLQISVDPSVCLIKSPLWYNKEGKSVIIEETKISADNDPDIGTSNRAYEDIKNGLDDNNISLLLKGIEAISNEKLYNLVDAKIKIEKKYNSLEELLNDELSNSGSVEKIGKPIKTLLERIGRVTVNVIPKQSTAKEATVLTTDIIDEIEITVNFKLDESAGSAQNTLKYKSTQAIDALSFLNDLPLDYFYKDEYSEIGIMKNIYVNIDYLYQKATDVNIEIGDNKEKYEISLYTYLKTIIRDIQVSIGNLNSFEIHVDPVDNNVARVIDINYTEPEKATYNNLFELQVHNLQSVVRSYSMQSQIFPDQSATIAIGAQVKGGQLGIQTNTMVDFNRNLTDRIILEKVDGQKSDITVDNNGNTTVTNGIAQIVDAFAALKKQPVESDNKIDNSKLTSDAKNSLRDVIVYFQSITSSPGSNRNLIPIKLSLEMDGIGGLVIGHMFKLPKNVVPKGYRGDGNVGSQLGNVITSIGHTIGNGDWVTKIDTLNVVLNDRKNAVPFNKVLLEKTLARESNAPGANDNNIPSALSMPNAAMLKKNLETIKINNQVIATVKENQLNNGGEITQGIAGATFAVLSLIKSRYPEITLEVTSGNDTFHQRNAGFSNHKIGKAVDFTISPATQQNKDKVEAILNEYQRTIGGKPYPTFRFLNEYNTKTKNSTGGHFHMSWDVDTVGA
jgi:hypothetical protein